MAIGKEGNVKWVDGLRGLASATVVITHLARSFDEELFSPTVSENGPSRFLQWPFIRVLIQGRIGVAIFSMVTGYVCALKPIKLCREGNQEAALSSISRSALRRVPRVVIPPALATSLVWVITQLGAFNVAKHSGSSWISSTSPGTWPTAQETVYDLINNIALTWTHTQNSYDPNQWTLLPLLKGGMMIYVFILATCNLAPRYRMMATLGMWLYFHRSNDSTFGMQFFWGAFLVELQMHTPAKDFITGRPRLCRILCVLCMTVGLYVASSPEYHSEWASWSQKLRNAIAYIVPRDADFPRHTTGLGLELISLGLYFSPWLRDMLSNQWLLWLGKQSFAVYLLHGPLLRSVLCWMLFGFVVPQDHADEEGNMVQTDFPRPSGVRLFLCLSFWFPLNYGAAVLWTTYVDSWCNRVTEKIVARIKEDKGEKNVLPVRKD